MKKGIKKILFLLNFTFLFFSGFFHGRGDLACATSLSSIEMAVETKFELETENAKIEVRPARNPFFDVIVLTNDLTVTFSKEDIVYVPVTELKNIVFVAKEGTFHYLHPRRGPVFPIIALFEGIKNPVRFFVGDIDLSGILKCKKEGEYFNCTMKGTDVASVVLRKPDQNEACIMFVSKNKESIDKEIREVMRTKNFKLYLTAQSDVYETIGKKNGIRVFCITGTPADVILKKEKEKEKITEIEK